MNKLLLPGLFVMLMNSFYARGSESIPPCFGAPMTQPGVFQGSCTVLAPSLGNKPQTIQFKLDSPNPMTGTSDDGFNGLAVSPFPIPVVAGNSDTVYMYGFQFYNLSGTCQTGPAEQLRILVGYSPPFCQPTAKGTLQCDDGVAEDPNPTGGLVMAAPQDGAKLHLEGGNSILKFSCDGSFSRKAYP